MTQLDRATAPGGAEVVTMLVDLVTAHGGALAVVELSGALHHWSAGAEALLGHRATDVAGRQLSDVTEPGLSQVDIAEALVAGMEGVWTREHELVSRAGRPVLVRTSATAVVWEGVQRLLVASSPLESSREGGHSDAEPVALVKETARTEGPVPSPLESSILEAAHDGMWVTSIDGHTLYANGRMADILGCPRDELLGKSALDCFTDPWARDQVRDHLRRRAAGVTEHYELPVCTADGSTRWLLIAGSPLYDAEGVHIANLAVFADITERKGMESALGWVSLFDELTGLPNRVLFRDRLEQLQQSGREVGLILLDLDRFRAVNDRLAPEGGDLVMRAVAARLAEAAREGDTTARLGGDEFAILCRQSDPHVVRRIAADMSAALEEPFLVDGQEVFLTASVGVAVSVDGTGDVLRAAGAALCQAKVHGRARIAVYDEAMAARLQHRFTLVSDLRRALERDELHVAYQPIVQLDSGRPVGIEALLRWTDPSRGPVSPAEFIPVAEDAGLMPRLGAWVLSRACRDAAAHATRGRHEEELYVSVNVSADQVAEHGIVDVVRAALSDSDLPAGRLMLEITETAVIADKARVTETLHALRRLGVRVGIDDFGTGYSSLDYLRQFPVDTIKIDRSFIARMNEDEEDRAIVASLLSLAGTLGLCVVAEGVETNEQRHALRRLGCMLGQGFLWSPAVPAAGLSQVLETLRLSPHGSARGRGTSAAGSRQRLAASVSAGVPAAIAGRIMALHGAGCSLSSIAGALNTEGSRTPRGTRWHRSSVAGVIAELSFPGEGFAPAAPRRPAPTG